MTPAAAYDILALPPDATPAQIAARAAELEVDFQLRLANAPTPNLRRLYQRQLQELAAARQALASAPTASSLNLPTLQPPTDFGNGATSVAPLPPAAGRPLTSPAAAPQPGPSVGPPPRLAGPAPTGYKLGARYGLLALLAVALCTVLGSGASRYLNALAGVALLGIGLPACCVGAVVLAHRRYKQQYLFLRWNTGFKIGLIVLFICLSLPIIGLGVLLLSELRPNTADDYRPEDNTLECVMGLVLIVFFILAASAGVAAFTRKAPVSASAA